jgi:hypothetical protein
MTVPGYNNRLSRMPVPSATTIRVTDSIYGVVDPGPAH